MNVHSFQEGSRHHPSYGYPRGGQKQRAVLRSLISTVFLDLWTINPSLNFYWEITSEIPIFSISSSEKELVHGIKLLVHPSKLTVAIQQCRNSKV